MGFYGNQWISTETLESFCAYMVYVSMCLVAYLNTHICAQVYAQLDYENNFVSRGDGCSLNTAREFAVSQCLP